MPKANHLPTDPIFPVFRAHLEREWGGGLPDDAFYASTQRPDEPYHTEPCKAFRLFKAGYAAAESRAEALTRENEGLREAVKALDGLPTMPKVYDWAGATGDMFDNELRHETGKAPVDYLRGWLSMLRPFAYATKDDSWGELEKLISTIMRNYSALAEGVRKARAVLPPTADEPAKGEA